MCLGNICRSPLAEAALRLEAERIGLAVRVDSAGTGNWHAGEPPDPRAQATAKAHGADISGLRARQVTSADFDRFTYVLALDRDNLATLARIAPTRHTARLALLMDMVPGRHGEPVADPYFGDDAGFEQTWTDVAEAARFIAASLTGA